MGSIHEAAVRYGHGRARCSTSPFGSEMATDVWVCPSWERESAPNRSPIYRRPRLRGRNDAAVVVGERDPGASPG